MAIFGKIIKSRIMRVIMSTHLNKRELLRQKRKAQQRRKIYITVLIIIGVLVVFGLFAFLPKLISKSANYGSSQGFVLGDPNAPVKVVAFSSYSCGYCKIFSESLEKDFIEDYVDTGKVYYRYVN
ncbi:MAG: thioredoxin domain-containing protein, partial [Kosmotogaceae bacterium]